MRSRSSSDGSADRAGDPGAAEPAIAERVFRQVLLVVVLSKVELRRLADLSGDGAVAGALQARLEAFARGLGSTELLGRIGVDRRAVLGADIVALTHALGRIVAFPENL